jgi:hypothetical protein
MIKGDFTEGIGDIGSYFSWEEKGATDITEEVEHDLKAKSCSERSEKTRLVKNRKRLRAEQHMNDIYLCA